MSVLVDSHGLAVWPAQMIAILDVLDIKPNKSFRRPKGRAYYDELLELDHVTLGPRTKLLAGVVLPARYDVFG
jgi:hypothetical protein